MVSLRLALSNPTLPEITDGYEIKLHHSMGHDQSSDCNASAMSLIVGLKTFLNAR
ncbi:hypothetical protein GGD49_006395 [Rhizobium tropici]|nr:hypothetical protein [Rhizobium tropici]